MINRIINYIRKNNPLLYFRLIAISDEVKSSKSAIHIFDNCGGSFKDYIAGEDMAKRLEALKSGLDDYSCTTIDILFKRLQNYPEHRYGVKVTPSRDNIVGGLLNEEKPELAGRARTRLKQVAREIKFPVSHMDPSVFYFDHGLTYLPGNVTASLKGKDFIDLGAYFGDSALTLLKYNYRKIFSVEFSPKAIENYKTFMKLNKVDSARYQIIPVAMAASDKAEPIFLKKNDYTLYSEQICKEEDAQIKVERRSLDSLVNEFAIEPKLIKADIEGFALECMKGASQTLKKFRPVLSLAIYHNPQEFFETKPYLEGLLDNYAFMIRKMATSPFGLRSTGETILLAYPDEMVNN